MEVCMGSTSVLVAAKMGVEVGWTNVLVTVCRHRKEHNE